MRKLFKYIGKIILISLLGIFAYYFYSIHEARQYTRDVIVKDMKRAQWRSLNGKIQKFEISSSDLSRRQIEILIKVQDPGFYSHNGVDLSTPGAGLTTITQAIVKKLYFDNFKPGIAKIKQTLIAHFVVDEFISKDEQINLFINMVYLGDVDKKPVTGLESAASAYYRQPLKMLTEDQYISLVAMLISPNTFHIIDHPEWNMDRTNRIKALIAGKYNPKGLMDQYYGDLSQDVINAGLPPASYFKSSSK